MVRGLPLIPARLTPHLVVSLLAIACAGAIAARMLPDNSAGWFVRVLAVCMAVGIGPGAAVALAYRPRISFGVFEFLGLSLGLSFGLIQLLTVAALSLHVPPWWTLTLLAGLVVVLLTVASLRSGEGVSLTLGPGDIVLGALVVVVGVFLYGIGSPVGSGEDRIHVSLIQRLAYLASPGIENVYYAPGLVYTYPFPGTHYLLALMSRVGDIEPLFLYDKLRAFWGPAAIVLVYGCARAIFGSVRVALAAAIVAVAFVANGMFAAVPGMYWAQLAPYSHASDVAMGVLLPALLLLAFTFIRSSGRHESWFFLGATLVMAFMLTAVHTREIVQFEMYMGACLVALALTRGEKTVLTRTAILFGAVAAIVVAYATWHGWRVPDVDGLISEELEPMRELWSTATWGALFGPPLPMLGDYMPAYEPMFSGWTPLLLVASPFVLYAFRHEPLAWLVGGGIGAYLLVIRFPAFGIPYTLATYHEILYTPVRNVIFFVHILAGVSLYLVAAWLARYSYVALTVVALVLSWIVATVAPVFARASAIRNDLLFVSVIVGLGIAFALARRSTPASPAWITSPRARWALALALLLGPIFWQSRIPDSAIVTGVWSNPRPTPDAFRQGAPPPDLINLARQRIPATAVLAVDVRDEWQPSLFLPQQMVVWPGRIDGLIAPERMFARYYAYAQRAEQMHRDQPFFNADDSRDERLSFIRDTGATHVLVSPRTYAMMSQVLARDADLYTVRYDGQMWALYEIVR